MDKNDHTDMLDSGLNFAFPGVVKSSQSSIIKVIGVGGGGDNAVNYMYRQGIHDVSYVVCNTDQKALDASPVPNKLLFGDELGAGNNPEIGREKAEESIEEIKNMLNDGTRMVFITAGMGGGTGTGAGPVVARCAREANILTVGIVTIPFVFEGVAKINQALDGVERMVKYVDALLVINNERLREIYADLSIVNAFAKADDTLCIAAKSIAEIITMRGIMNLDFNDVQMVLRDGGVAVMSTGEAEGERRVTKAIEMALHSPLLNNNDIFNSKKVLLKISFNNGDGNQALKMEEVNEVHEFMGKFSKMVQTKFGIDTDNSLGNKVKITLLASGFKLKHSTEQTESSADVIRETDEEEAERLRDRFVTYYGGEGSQPKRRHKFHYHIFKDSELDNENVISMVATSPTSSRSLEELNRIKDNGLSEETDN